MDIVLILIAGFGGGVVRGLVGFTKHQFKFKNVKFDLKYFLATMFISGIVGLLTVAAVKGVEVDLLAFRVGPAIAFIAGYAGGDFIENLYKILFKKTSLFRE